MSDIQTFEITEQPSSEAMVAARAAGRDTAAVAAFARERYETEGAIIMAQKFPRTEAQCRQSILRSCGRPKFAELGVYAFPMGGETIEGPTVALAREMARAWGHIASGFRVLAVDPERCELHLQGFAIDYQTGARRTEEARVTAKVWRKKESRWIDLLDEKDRVLAGDRERQLALLIGRVASKLERNCVIRLMPADLVDEAMDVCKATEETQTSPETAAKAVDAFAKLGVKREQIEARLGTAVERASSAKLAELARIARSIAAKESAVEDWFEVAAPKPTSGVAAAKAALGITAAPVAETPPQAETSPGDDAPVYGDPTDAAPQPKPLRVQVREAFEAAGISDSEARNSLAATATGRRQTAAAPYSDDELRLVLDAIAEAAHGGGDG